MSFLNSIMLFGMAAAAMPIIIHLLNRRRHRTVKWAAMQFLLKATRESRGKKRLRHILILTFRALALAALFFALARPVLSSLLGWGGGQVDTVVLILDRSQSMEIRPTGVNETKRERVLKRVAKSMEKMDGAKLVLIDSASAEAVEVPSPDVLAELSTTDATDTSADFPALMRVAIDYLASAKPSSSEIWIASDLQEGDWAPDSSRWELVRAGITTLDSEPGIRVLAMRERPQENYRLSLENVRREGDELVLRVVVARNQDSGVAPLQVTYAVGGARSGEEITIEGESVTFDKKIPVPAGDSGGWGFVSVQSDQAPRDNVAFFSFGSDTSTLTYLVTSDENSEMTDNLGLVAALPGYRRQQVEWVNSNNLQQIDWSKASLIVWEGALPQGTNANLLEEFLTQGGAALFFPPNEASDIEFLGHTWGAFENSPRDQFFVVGGWEQNESLLRDGEDGVAIPLRRMRAIKRASLTGSSLALATWDDQLPLLTRQVVDQGMVFFATTKPDYTWSNLGDATFLLPMVQRAIEVGNRRLGSSFAGVVNRGDARLRPGEVRERLDDYFTENSTADPAYLAGVYRSGEEIIAVNRPASEDNPTQLSDEVIAAIFEGTRFSLFDQSAAKDSSLVTPFWRPFVLAMIFFLFGEALLCLPKRQPVEPALAT